jgi:hypothetical protein
MFYQFSFLFLFLSPMLWCTVYVSNWPANLFVVYSSTWRPTKPKAANESGKRRRYRRMGSIYMSSWASWAQGRIRPVWPRCWNRVWLGVNSNFFYLLMANIRKGLVFSLGLLGGLWSYSWRILNISFSICITRYSFMHRYFSQLHK